MWGVGLMVAPIMGPTVGGWITDNWNWRWNFYINVPTGAFAALMVYAYVHIRGICENSAAPAMPCRPRARLSPATPSGRSWW